MARSPPARRRLPDDFATHYGEGVIEVRVPTAVYDEHSAQFVVTHFGTLPGTELASSGEKPDLLSTFERIIPGG